MTAGEAALAALFATVAPLAQAATRNGLFTADMRGLSTALSVVDGAPQVEAEELGPWIIHYRHEAGVAVAVAAREEAASRAALATLMQAVGAALAADRTLGGAVDGLTFGAPFETQETRALGGADLLARVIPVALYYSAPGANPLEAA